MSDMTRAEIDKIIGEDFDEISENGLKAIVSLSLQLDAANAKIALHESENVTRGLLISKLEAQLQTVQSSLTNARRTLPTRLWSDCGTSLASEVADVITLDKANAMVGAALREAATEGASHVTYNLEAMTVERAILALAPDATAALDRALEQMRERCHGLVVDFPYGAEGPADAQDRVEWAMTQIGNDIIALPLHEEQKP